MSKKVVLCASIILCAITVSLGCSMQPSKPKMEIVSIPGGTVAPALGVGFDANYDPSLDSVIPDYKILTVAYINNSMNIVQMNSEHDKWWVENRKGAKIKATINLRDVDPDAWAKLPRKLRILIEYPLLVPIGGTETIDLLFKKNVNLNEFRSIIFRPAGSNQEFRVIPREQ